MSRTSLLCLHDQATGIVRRFQLVAVPFGRRSYAVFSYHHHHHHLFWFRNPLAVMRNPQSSKSVLKMSSEAEDDYIVPKSRTTANLPRKSHQIADDVVERLMGPLNATQREAVAAEIGPILVSAGPGSGKTRVLTHRIGYMIAVREARPESILAITFTNKAANEMKTRLGQLSEIVFRSDSEDKNLNSRVWIGTFHAICCRLLYLYGELVGLKPQFRILDASESKKIVQSVLKKLGKEDTSSKVLGAISRVKTRQSALSELIKPLQVVFNEYQNELRDNNLVDFDDLLLYFCKLLETHLETRRKVQNRFRHILVDECQDTNQIQFDILNLLVRPEQSVFLVGDIDQSIYGFRGANYENINEFQKMYPKCTKFALFENYRSTPLIVAAAHSLISQNANELRKPMKSMLDEQKTGATKQIIVKSFGSADLEARHIAEEIRLMRHIHDFHEMVILYRTNSQSRVFEKEMVRNGIPFQVVGGFDFFNRIEVRDIISYLRLVNNARDTEAFWRIVNRPRRGIGEKFEKLIEDTCVEAGLTPMDLVSKFHSFCTGSLSDCPEAEGFSKKQVKVLADFHAMYLDMMIQAHQLKMPEFIDFVIKRTDYLKFLETLDKDVLGDEESTMDRLSNLEELKNMAKSMMTEFKHFDRTALVTNIVSGEPAVMPTATEVDEWDSLQEEIDRMRSPLAEYLNQAALTGDRQSKTDKSVSLMTVHRCKGLEFAAVFMAGCSDGLFPMVFEWNKDGDPSAQAKIEEERRLFYVAMTRAKQNLLITYFGIAPSRYLNEIDSSYLQRKDSVSPKSSQRVLK